MKRIKSKPKQIISHPSHNLEVPPSSPRRNVFAQLFFCVLLFTIAFRIYKADRTGIIFDEARTFRSYAGSVDQALGSYDRPNNHVLNSIFVHYTHQYFGSYEHFVRIPSLTAGIIFSLALAFVVHRLVKTKILALASLAMISLVPFVFDYSYLARGYAFALAAIMLQMALVLWWLEHPIPYRYVMLPGVIIALLNFLALGAMLSSILLLSAFNLTFVLLFSPLILREVPRPKIPALINFFVILPATALPVFLLYRRIYQQIFSHEQFADFSARWKGWADFVDFLDRLLVESVFGAQDNLGIMLRWLALFLIMGSLLYHIYTFSRAVKSSRARNFLRADKAAALLLVTTALALIIMFVYGVIMKQSLGYLRNHVFMIPLVLLCLAVMLDRFLCGIKKKSLHQVLSLMITLTICGIIGHNFPSAGSAGGQSVSGPLLRCLKQIDPDKNWKIAFSEKAWNHSLAFLYYRQFDYKFSWVKAGDCDLYVCLVDERPPQAICLEWETFRPFGCAAALARPLENNNLVLSAELLER